MKSNHQGWKIEKNEFGYFTATNDNYEYYIAAKSLSQILVEIDELTDEEKDMKPHEEYAEKVLTDIHKMDVMTTLKSPIGAFYHDKIRVAIYVIEKQIDLINEIAVQSMAEVVVRKHKLLNKALKYLKNK